MDYAEILSVYGGSDGDATKRLYERLDAIGPEGAIAVDLFRAHKSSSRAKAYRGGPSAGLGRGKGSYRRMAYQRKNWAIDNLCRSLDEHAQLLGIGWGWGEDPAQPVHCHVLYVDLPTGQVSFHSEWRGRGTAYPGEWDGERGTGPARICRWIAGLLGRAEGKAA